ncbi:Na+/H+ antiporter subunit E [Noviherbaspirillum suwonense]|uniref:Multisubunit potassium/proton antiporter, PhaE subunit n=1 Tax=Noviherbaspirillum suwonense TaxID=1224511 RepID=A0ABY1QQF6_9BURK|nr:Na+/H+ antiporter subunit E [Noviherbaspirillum suwonense]SMP77334.1 multisubunit potassium/proton antiporter, PhaE subunit [Noviherbaspirillum suwonense]
MRRWLPFPWMSAVLLGLWLLLNQSLDPAHLLLAAGLGIAVPLLTRNLQPLGYPKLARPFLFLRLLGMSLVEIVRSGLNVGRIILFSKADGLNSQFITIPLDLRNPHGLALLSCLINSTPGTVWVEILPDRHALALHVFDLHDEQWWIDTIKSRYEQPLIDIFE